MGPTKELVRELKREARVVMENEFCTSKVCPSAWPWGDHAQHEACDARLVQTTYKWKKQGEEELRTRSPWSLKTCPRCSVVCYTSTQLRLTHLACSGKIVSHCRASQAIKTFLQ